MLRPADGWIAAHEGGDTGSLVDVVGHLIHAEADELAAARTGTILEHGETRAFDQFDRLAQFDAARALRSRAC